MNLARKISQIKNLEEVKPDKRWEKTTKYNLLEEIAAQNRLMQANKLSTTQKVDLFAMRVFNRLAPSMTKVLAGFLILMMFFGVNMAAQASVPGETLWPVKRSIEEAELSIAFSPVKKTEVYIKHVNERLDEIDKILDKPSEPAVENTKEKAIKQAVTHLEKDVISVDSSLKIVKQEKKAIEVVELVKKVTDATKEVEDNLAEKKKKVEGVDQDESLGQILDNAQLVNKQVKKSAVSVAIEVHEEVTKIVENQESIETVNSLRATSTSNQGLPIGNAGLSDTTTSDILVKSEQAPDNAKVNPEEAAVISNLVKEIVASEINQVSLEVKDVKAKADVVLDTDIANIKKDSLTTQTPVVNSVELEQINTIKKESEAETNGVLEEAKVLLDNGMLKDAFEKVSQLQEKYNQAGVTLQKIEKVIIEQSNSGNSGNTTSTSPLNLNIKPEGTVVGASVINREESDIKIKEEELILDN